MAELPKFEEFEMLEPLIKEKTSEEENALQYPKHKLSRVSKIEKVVAGLFIGLAFVTAAVTVKMTTMISKAEEVVSLIQIGNVTKQDDVDKLEQEKIELSRTERIKEAAEKGNMEIVDNNIRNVE